MGISKRHEICTTPISPPYTRMYLSFVQGKLCLVVDVNLDYVNREMKVKCIYFHIVVMFYFILIYSTELNGMLREPKGKEEMYSKERNNKIIKEASVVYLNRGFKQRMPSNSVLSLFYT